MDEKIVQKALELLETAKRGMTYQVLAQRLGVGIQTPCRWLKKRRINPVYARLVLEKLG